MVTISKDNDVVTLINVFTVRPEHQQRLVDELVNATQTVMRNQPGYVSVNIHKSLNGTPTTRSGVAVRPSRLCSLTRKRSSTCRKRKG